MKQVYFTRIHRFSIYRDVGDIIPVAWPQLNDL